eukprot:COSAG01_NODE_2307_length_7944_cov_31.370045_3_plen_80_part_00
MWVCGRQLSDLSAAAPRRQRRCLVPKRAPRKKPTSGRQRVAPLLMTTEMKGEMQSLAVRRHPARRAAVLSRRLRSMRRR